MNRKTIRNIVTAGLIGALSTIAPDLTAQSIPIRIGVPIPAPSPAPAPAPSPAPTPMPSRDRFSYSIEAGTELLRTEERTTARNPVEFNTVAAPRINIKTRYDFDKIGLDAYLSTSYDYGELQSGVFNDSYTKSLPISAGAGIHFNVSRATLEVLLGINKLVYGVKNFEGGEGYKQTDKLDETGGEGRIALTYLNPPVGNALVAEVTGFKAEGRFRTSHKVNGATDLGWIKDADARLILYTQMAGKPLSFIDYGLLMQERGSEILARKVDPTTLDNLANSTSNGNIVQVKRNVQDNRYGFGGTFAICGNVYENFILGVSLQGVAGDPLWEQHRRSFNVTAVAGFPELSLTAGYTVNITKDETKEGFFNVMLRVAPGSRNPRLYDTEENSRMR